MRRILVLGDIHGTNHWKEIIEKERPQLTIFLGDYVSSYDIPAKEQIYNMNEIMNYKEEHPDEVILLRGNHDMQHMGYSWAECSKLDHKVQQWMITERERFLKLSQWIYIERNILFAHAGVSTEWLNYTGLTLETINEAEPDAKFGFIPCKLSDYTGISPTQPCTWIRPSALSEYMVDGYIQVVGHTNVGHVSCVQNDKGQIWLCDAMQNKRPEYLMIGYSEGENETVFSPGTLWVNK